LADIPFHRAWLDAIRQPSFDAIKRYLTELAGRDNVRKALTKPDEAILKWDPELSQLRPAIARVLLALR
jgi:hypothetical protein